MSKKRAGLFPFAQYPLLFGHRGCSIIAPENSMAAFQQILDHKVPGVELDVHMCKSGELVVTHDSNLKRVTGLDADVEDTHWEQIRELEAGSWFSESYRGERIPLLEDVLDLLDDKVYYDIELKQLRGRYGPLEEKIAQLITRRGLQDRVMVSSFDPLSIRRLRHFDHGLHTAHIYSDYEEVPRFLRNGAGRFLCNPQVLKPNRFKINRNTLFFKQRLEGYPLITWTEDEREKVDELLKMGVDGVITNVPEQLVSLFQLYWN